MKIKRECIKLKGMHDIKRPLQVFNPERAKTLSSLERIQETTEPTLNERLIELALRKERQRFQKQDQSLERSLKNVAEMRALLLGKKIKNQRIMALRKGLQEARYRAEVHAPSTKPAQVSERKYKKIKLNY